jgi:hypothetical protein
MSTTLSKDALPAVVGGSALGDDRCRISARIQTSILQGINIHG